MTTQFILSPIQAKSKGEIKRLRQAGFIPVSIQHKGTTTLHFQQETRPLDEYLQKHGESTLLEVLIAPENTPQRVIVQRVQRNPMTAKIQEVTFQHIRRDDTLKTHVSLVFTGEPVEVHNGEAMVQHQLDRLEIECDPANLPDHVTINISSLHPGDVLRVSDVPVNPRFKILNPPNTVLASLTSTRFGTTGDIETETPADVV